MNDKIVGLAIEAAAITIAALTAHVAVQDRKIKKLNLKIESRDRTIEFLKRQMLSTIDVMSEEQCGVIADKMKVDLKFEKIINGM